MNAQQPFQMKSSTQAPKTSVQPVDQFLTKENIPSPDPSNPLYTCLIVRLGCEKKPASIKNLSFPFFIHFIPARY